MKRVGVFKDFSRKPAAVLLTTDIAARGLDIPAVHWVVQLDCPEDVDMYIHRVGRTARYKSDGKSLLLLLPSEVAMVDLLRKRKVPIAEVEANPSRVKPLVNKFRAFCAEVGVGRGARFCA